MFLFGCDSYSLSFEAGNEHDQDYIQHDGIVNGFLCQVDLVAGALTELHSLVRNNVKAVIQTYHQVYHEVLYNMVWFKLTDAEYIDNGGASNPRAIGSFRQ